VLLSKLLKSPGPLLAKVAPVACFGGRFFRRNFQISMLSGVNFTAGILMLILQALRSATSPGFSFTGLLPVKKSVDVALYSTSSVR
jgi:hypothetical protein